MSGRHALARRAGDHRDGALEEAGLVADQCGCLHDAFGLGLLLLFVIGPVQCGLRGLLFLFVIWFLLAGLRDFAVR